MRPEPRLLHLDSAAAGRSSWAVLDAVTTHLRAEASDGGYVAAAAAAGTLDTARAHVLELLGWETGTVALVHSAHDALHRLLLGWGADLPVTVLHAAGEYGPNLAVLQELGVGSASVEDRHAGGRHTPDPAAFASAIARQRPDLVHLTALGSHVGTVQPVEEVVAVCHAAGVPVVVDAAQSFGHVDATTSADVVYGTSRKWLAGPRGAGFVAVRTGVAQRLGLSRDPEPREPQEASIAARVGFAAALAQHVDLGPAAVRAGLAARGRRTREQLAELPGWEVVEALDEASATVTLRPPAGVDPAGVRARLIAEDGIVTTAAGVERAPGEMTGPVLRVSPHLDATDADVDRLAAALARQG
ncbi:aminotransferase class V-fold PLP-dependent enzyme [Kineosporiaceae bacterium B12]|nr:aminotransferase class V-fold PLP-dependent enzyme [Kineococcus rubinsiae]